MSYHKCSCGRAGETKPPYPNLCGKCGGWF